MSGVFPSNNIADEAATVLAAVDHLGYFFSAENGTVTVRLARDVESSGFPARAAGYPVSYRSSVMTRSEIDLIKAQVVAIGRSGPMGREGGFGVRYDVDLDRIRVDGHFPDDDVLAWLSALVNVDLTTVGCYVETDEEWCQFIEARTRTVPALLARGRTSPSTTHLDQSFCSTSRCEAAFPTTCRSQAQDRQRWCRRSRCPMVCSHD